MSKYRRVVPVLLLSDGYLVKPVKFGKSQYIGDPINAVKIFNDMEADELILLDIDPSRKKTSINFKLIEEITSEAFMPISYGGGVFEKDTGIKLNRLGIEKIILGSAAINTPNLISDLSSEMGSQGVVVCIDYKTVFRKQKVFYSGGAKKSNLTPEDVAVLAVKMGAGEILLQDMNREGTLTGYDISTLSKIRGLVDVPISILGGAGKILDFQEAFVNGASAACAGSLFVTQGPHKAVLISYPERSLLEGLRGFLPL